MKINHFRWFRSPKYLHEQSIFYEYKCRSLIKLIRLAVVFLLFTITGQAINAQISSVADPATGSGASAIIAAYHFGTQTPTLSDPCTCAEEFGGKSLFDDEIIVTSFNRTDRWLIASQTGACLRGTDVPIAISTPIPLVAAGVQTLGGTDSVFIFSLPISHEAGRGYTATIESGNFPLRPLPVPATVSNTCTKVAAGLAFNNTIPLSINTPINLQLEIRNSTNNALINPFTGTDQQVGELGQLFVGTASNPTRILVDNFDVTNIPSTTIFDPSGALAIGGFNPLLDTIITFVYDADTSYMAGTFINGGGLSTAIQDNPGCVDRASANVVWSTCTATTTDYHVGENNAKYNNEDRTFIFCPDDPNTQRVKIAFAGRFDIAPGDVLTIYEGIGTGGLVRDQLTAGGYHAATSLRSTWFQATCDAEDGCLTLTFEPDDNESNNGTGFQFVPTCEDRPAVLTCPSDTIVAGACNINNSNSVAALYVLPAPLSDCNYEPVIIGSVMVVDATGTPLVTIPQSNLSDLNVNGEYLDSDGDGVLDIGETIFLEMATYIINYDYQSLNPRGIETCNYALTVGEIALICNNQINISLSSNGCATVIRPDMLIEGDACDGGFTVNILEGADKGTDVMNYTNVGRAIKVEVVAPSGNRCWGLVLVEDKAPPIFLCRPDTAIFCGIPLDPAVSGVYPEGGQDCSPFSYIFSDSEQTPYGCERLGLGDDPDTIGMMVRTWRAVDEGGIMSPPCTQNVYLLKPKLTAANLVWPNDTILYCNNNPDTRPAVTGFPGVKLGNDTVPLSHTCFFGIDFRDIVFDTDCEGVQNIQRTWSILDWCSTGAALAVIQDLDPQIIQILDTIGPAISNFPDTLLYTSDHGACSADVQLPAITVADDCSPSDAKFRILGPSSTIFNQAGVMRNVPFGTHEFTYIAEDGCGNQNRRTISLTIKDNTAPTAIARELSVSLISDTDLTWVYASSFDGGSHDNCSIASILARKLGDVTFTDAVGFTCEDIGTTMVEIQVIDECGNVGLAMNEVVVTDKLGVCECNMNTSLKIAETSGVANNDGIICLGDRVMLTGCAVVEGGLGDGDGEGDERLAANASFTYLWSTGDSIAQITLLPTTSQVYMVTITDDTGCEVVETVSIQVNPLPDATITLAEQSLVINDGIICAGSSISLQAPLGGVQYNWNATTINVNSPNTATTTASPTETTTYSVVVTNADGCTATDSVTVIVNELAVVSAGADTTICAGTSVQLSASGGTSFLWSPKTGLSDPTIFNPIATPTATTTYSVQVTTGSGCSAIAMQTVTINPALVATITANPDRFVINPGEDIEMTATPTGGTAPYTYTWQTEVGTENTAVITASPSSSFTYIVTITDALGCTATASRSLTVNSTLTADIVFDATKTTLCLGDSVVLTAVGMGGMPTYTYQWSAIAGGVTTDTSLVKPTTTTTYIVTVTDALGFTALASQEITIAAVNPVIAVTDTSGLVDNDGILCTNDEAILVASGGSTYLWNTTSTNDSLIVDSTGTYTVTVTNSTGCTAEESVTVAVHPQIVFDKAASPATFVIGASTDLSITVTAGSTTPNYCYQWSLPDGSFTSVDAMTTFTPTQTGIFIFDIFIEDKSNGCTTLGKEIVTVTANIPPPISLAALSGTIITESGEMVEETTINLAGYEMPPSVTSATGIYQFEEVPMYDNYTVTPEKNRNPLNGVSTYDLVLMSKHILGVQRLTSPYKQIAADVNRSGAITAYDMVQLRRLILNLDTEFPNNKAWRFIDAAYEFTNPANPLIEVIPETYQITDLSEDMTWLDFVAIKVGDLNNSARPNRLVNAESRSATDVLQFHVQQALSEDGQSLIFNFTADDFQSIEGYQFALDFDPTILNFEKILPSKWVGEEYFGLQAIERGLITTSWNTATALPIEKEDILFSLSFQLKGAVTSDNLLTITSDVLAAEAYKEGGELLAIELIEAQVVPEVATKQLELYQNRPNPFTGKTTIGFKLPTATTAILRIFDTNGKVIHTYPGKYEAGYNELIISSANLKQYGALYYQLATPTQIATKKMIHAK